MLKKLMKHELRATGRVMGPMLLLTLIAAVGGNIATHGLLEANHGMLNFLGMVLLAGFVLTLAAVIIVSFVLMIQRFYKNLLRDEGYLMMTLPVTVHEHVLSKLLVSLIWMAATAAAVILAMLILLYEQEVVHLIAEGFAQLQLELRFGGVRVAEYMMDFAACGMELVLMMIVAAACTCLQLYAAMAAGHSFTHHKGLLSVAACFVFSIAWNIIQNAMSYPLNLMDVEGFRMWMQNLLPTTQMHVMLLGVTGLLLIPCALWYVITIYFLKHRLNIG
ncbi:MAG: hypothetical protein IJ418_20120 [Clostridia bacterium]|nr:hypothetical protein [Clostridia bacterium]